ncbi:MAG: transcriptional regulator [Bacteroidetes bacterium]|nr:MAG: transcriptional regulator [Bacteroidota bacterium]
MKNILQELNKAFESKVRLGIMSALMVNEWIEFKELKELLELSDGNLASHISALEKLGYVHVKKEFKGKRPLTSYTATVAGVKAFEKHLQALEQLIKR